MIKVKRICFDCKAEKVREERPALDRRGTRVYQPYQRCPVCGGPNFAFAGTRRG